MEVTLQNKQNEWLHDIQAFERYQNSSLEFEELR